MHLAQVLDKLMSTNNISAYKISKDTGISDRLIGYWRKGEKLPGAENLLIIANYFGISVDYLLTGKEQSIQKEQLSENERILFEKYKQLNPTNKAKILERIDTLLEIEKSNDN